MSETVPEEAGSLWPNWGSNAGQQTGAGLGEEPAQKSAVQEPQNEPTSST